MREMLNDFLFGQGMRKMIISAILIIKTPLSVFTLALYFLSAEIGVVCVCHVALFLVPGTRRVG